MSCADVMYQPYSPYFPVYQRSQVPAPSVSALTPTQTQASADYRKYCVSKCVDSDIPLSGSQAATECRLRAATSRGMDLSDCRDKEKADAQYLSANCVVFTYYSGDISSVVDEHFSRALSQSSAASASTSYPSAAATTTTAQHNATKSSKDCPPMSHRNFPPSFWNSNYQQSSNSNLAGSGLSHIPVSDLSYGSDPYHHHHHHHPQSAALHASLHHHHHQNPDPWHYALSSQPGPYRSHDLSTYHPGVTGTSRFNPQYSSLLLQPSVRSATRLSSAAAACASSLDKTATDTWGASRYHDPMAHVESTYGPPYGGMASMTGLEGQPQESKDLYWF